MKKPEIINLITNYGGLAGLDQAANDLLIAMCQVESNFKPDALNPDSGAKGLFQFMDRTFIWICRKLKVPVVKRNAFDPDLNVKCAIWYIKYLAIDRKLGWSPVILAMAWNWGEGNVMKFTRCHFMTLDPAVFAELPKETYFHIRKVLRKLKIIKRER